MNILTKLICSISYLPHGTCHNFQSLLQDLANYGPLLACIMQMECLIVFGKGLVCLLISGGIFVKMVADIRRRILFYIMVQKQHVLLGIYWIWKLNILEVKRGWAWHSMIRIRSMTLISCTSHPLRYSFVGFKQVRVDMATGKQKPNCKFLKETWI